MTNKNKKQQEQLGELEQSKEFLTEDIVSNGTIKVTELIEGAINTSWQSGLSGWIWDRSKPYQPLKVELLVNNEVIAQSVADKFDMALAEREIGNGKHAFSLRAKSWPELVLPVELSVRIADSFNLLWHTTIQNQADIEGLCDSYPIGHVDGVVSDELRGWAFDLANPIEPFSVDIHDNGNVIMTIDCSEYRKDLLSAGYTNGYCGFSFALPISLLDGQMHSLSVCYSGTQRSLPNGTLLYGLTKESALTKHLDNLVKTVNKCQSELATVEQRLLARHEALLVIQRENMERELQVLRKLLIANADKQDAPSENTMPVVSVAARPTTKKTGRVKPPVGS